MRRCANGGWSDEKKTWLKAIDWFVHRREKRGPKQRCATIAASRSLAQVKVCVSARSTNAATTTTIGTTTTATGEERTGPRSERSREGERVFSTEKEGHQMVKDNQITTRWNC